MFHEHGYLERESNTHSAQNSIEKMNKRKNTSVFVGLLAYCMCNEGEIRVGIFFDSKTALQHANRLVLLKRRENTKFRLISQTENLRLMCVEIIYIHILER